MTQKILHGTFWMAFAVQNNLQNLNNTFVFQNAVFMTKTAFWTVFKHLCESCHKPNGLLVSTKPTGKTIKYQLSELRSNMIVALLKKTFHFIITEMKIGPWIFSETDTEKCPKPSRPVI